MSYSPQRAREEGSRGGRDHSSILSDPCICSSTVSSTGSRAWDLEMTVMRGSPSSRENRHMTIKLIKMGDKCSDRDVYGDLWEQRRQSN